MGWYLERHRRRRHRRRRAEGDAVARTSELTQEYPTADFGRRRAACAPMSECRDPHAQRPLPEPVGRYGDDVRAPHAHKRDRGVCTSVALANCQEVAENAKGPHL